MYGGYYIPGGMSSKDYTNLMYKCKAIINAFENDKHFKYIAKVFTTLKDLASKASQGQTNFPNYNLLNRIIEFLYGPTAFKSSIRPEIVNIMRKSLLQIGFPHDKVEYEAERFTNFLSTGGVLFGNQQKQNILSEYRASREQREPTFMRQEQRKPTFMQQEQREDERKIPNFKNTGRSVEQGSTRRGEETNSEQKMLMLKDQVQEVQQEEIEEEEEELVKKEKELLKCKENILLLNNAYIKVARQLRELKNLID